MNKLYCLLFVILVGATFAPSSMAKKQLVDKIVAVVDDGVITQHELQARIDAVRSTNDPNTLPDSDTLTAEVLDQLIIDNLQLQKAKRAGITIQEEELLTTATNIAKRNGKTLAEFREQLLSEGKNYIDFLQKIRDDLAIQRLQRGFIHRNIQISEQAVTEYLQSASGKSLTQEQLKLSHVVISHDQHESADFIKQQLQDLRKALQPSPEGFNAWVKGKSYRGLSISGSHLGWRPVDAVPTLFAQQAKPLDVNSIAQPFSSPAGWHLLWLQGRKGGDVFEYQVHARHILIKPSELRTPAQTLALATRIYESISQGDDFDLMAKEYSEDHGSALQGGDLGWSSPQKFVPEFRKQLTQINVQALSKPFKTEFGWHIVQKLGERQHNVTQEKRYQQAYEVLYQKKFTEELEYWLLNLRNDAFIDIKL